MKNIFNILTIAGLVVFLAGITVLFAIHDLSLISGTIGFGLAIIGAASVFMADTVADMTNDM